MEKPNKEYSNTQSPYVSILHANADLSLYGTFKMTTNYSDNTIFLVVQV